MNRILRYVVAPIAGFALGYAYYYFFGCKSGCPLKSNWLLTSFYGALLGLVLGLPGKKRKKDKEI